MPYGPLLAVKKLDATIVDVWQLGTAFAIASRVLVTAAHVVQEAFRRDEHGTPVGLRDANIAPYVLLTTTEPFPNNACGLGGIVPIYGVRTTAANDLAVLSTPIFDPRSGPQPRFSTVPLTIMPPEIGSAVKAIGYTDSRFEAAGTNEAGVVGLDVEPNLIISTGLIEEHFHLRRDARMINFPAVQGNFAAGKGMTGGPVITEDGCVCGIICSSIDPDDDHGGWTSTCALLPYLFAMSLDVPIAAGEDERRTILELAERGDVTTDGTHAKVHFEADGEEIRVLPALDTGDSASEHGR